MSNNIRAFCPGCGRKHMAHAHVLQARLRAGILELAQAKVIRNETLKKYEELYWVALGHMAQAEDELVHEAPELANMIRDQRIAWEADVAYSVDFMGLIRTASTLTNLNVQLRDWIADVRKFERALEDKRYKGQRNFDEKGWAG